MKLEWMGEYRELVESYIKASNKYARSYNQRIFHYEDVSFSASQIQVLEYIIEDNYASMSKLADRLGVTRTALTKHAATLETNGLIEKRHLDGNAKAYSLIATEKGHRAYDTYSHQIYESLFSGIFKQLDQMNESQVSVIKDIFKYLAERER